MPRCKNCDRPIIIPASARNKEFCGSSEGDSKGRCRQEWWERQRRQATRRLQQERQAEIASEGDGK